MKLGALGLGLVLSVTVLATTTDAHAQDYDVARHQAHAYAAGIALTATGASFLGTAAIAAGGTLVLMGNMSGPEGGIGALAALALGGIITGGCTVIGLSTLIPGLVLMGNNKPVKVRIDDGAVSDAHAAPPLPRFTSMPLLSATF